MCAYTHTDLSGSHRFTTVRDGRYLQKERAQLPHFTVVKSQDWLVGQSGSGSQAQDFVLLVVLELGRGSLD